MATYDAQFTNDSDRVVKEYVDLDDTVKLFFEKHSFIDYLKQRNGIKINRRYISSYNFIKKKNVNYQDITDTSIFIDLI